MRAALEEDDGGDYGTFQDPKGPARSATALITPDAGRAKWVMVAILSLLSGVNQGICYSYAPIASIAETRWQQHMHSTELITVFFIAYIPCSFVGSWLMDKKGLRFGVLLGAYLQAIGASVRYLATFAATAQTEAQLTLLGQLIASIAMPFMVNSPPVLSANWFPPSLRATATSIAVNANALGTAVVYLTAPFVVHSTAALPSWNACVAAIAIVSCVIAHVWLQSFPQSSTRFEDESVVSDVQLQDEYDWAQWGNAFRHNGFATTVITFSVAECVLNAMAALLGKFLSTDGFTKAQVGVIGAAFIVSSLVGGQLLSREVDKRRNHMRALQLCLLLTAAFLAAFKLTLTTHVVWTFVSLLLLGASLGPVQPVVLELGVECAYPTSEATVAALQQLCGNLLSAVLVPGLSLLRRTHADATGHVPSKYFYASPEWVLTALLLVTLVVFCFYDGEYKRFHHESGVLQPSALGGDATPTKSKSKPTTGRLPSFVAVTVKQPIVDASTLPPSQRRV